MRGDNSPDIALASLYENYINLVKKNYLYQPGHPIKVARFEEEVRKILKILDE